MRRHPHATLLDGKGGKLESRQGYQLYTIGDAPKIEVPKDTIRLLGTAFPDEKMPTVRKLQGDDVWNPYLALAMSAALADLQRQVRQRP